MSVTTYDIEIKQGAEFKLKLNLSSDTYILTGANLHGQIRRTPSDPEILAELDCDLTDGIDVGTFTGTVVLTGVETAAIPVEMTDGETFTPVLYAYDLQLVLLDKTAIALIQGEAEVTPGVTR